MPPPTGRWATALVAFAAALLWTAVPYARQTPAPAAITSDDVPVRGLWVARTSLTSPASVAAMVRAADAAGFTALFVQVRGRGEALYQSDLEPRASELAAEDDAFDPLRETLTLAHAAGLQVHAWFNVNLVSSATTLPRSRDHVVFQHPEWLMVPAALAPTLHQMDPRSPGYLGSLSRWTRGEDARVEGLFLSPLPDAAQRYTASLIAELVTRYPLDGLHFDYLRFPTNEFDYSRAALDEFRTSHARTQPASERARLDRAAQSNPAAWAAGAPLAWAAFRRDRLTALLARLQATARQARPGIVISAAVAPSPVEARDLRLQDWPAWSSAGHLDAVCPMAYSPDLAEFADQVAAARVAADRTPVWAGIGAYKLTSDQMRGHVQAAARAGAAGVVLFRYDSLSIGDPQAVTMRELRSLFMGPARNAGRR